MAGSSAGTSHTVIVDEGASGQRLDVALLALLLPAVPDLSRTRLKALLEAGAVAGPDARPWRDAARKVQPGQTFTLTIPPPIDPLPRGEDLPLSIVYEDGDLLVIDKAPGMTVHPAPGNHEHTLVNALIGHCGDTLSGIGGVRRPGIVHRLDKGTSGLLVAAKTDAAHAGLSAQLASRTLSRVYLAAVWGRPIPAQGRIEQPIARSPADRKKMAVVANGKAAVTDYAVVRNLGLSGSLVRCQLHTGRTHQIRVHMMHIGHPLIGDPAYGRRLTASARKATPAAAAFPRQALHAAGIGFIHPRTGEAMRFEAAPPEDIAELLEALCAIS